MGKTKGKRALERLSCRWEHNIKVGLRESGGKCGIRNVRQDMTDVALNGVRRREFGGFVLAVGFNSRKAGMMARQVGVGSRLS